MILLKKLDPIFNNIYYFVCILATFQQQQTTVHYQQSPQKQQQQQLPPLPPHLSMVPKVELRNQSIVLDLSEVVGGINEMQQK